MTGNRFFFLLLLVLIFTQVSPALSLTTSWHKMPQNERLSLHFEKDVPPLKVTRTGYLQLTIPLPSDFWKKEKKALPAILPDSDFIKRIDFTPKNIKISLKNRSIGFIFSPLEEEKNFLVDIFFDPVGKNWAPPAPKTAPKQPNKVQPKKNPAAQQPKTTVQQGPSKAATAKQPQAAPAAPKISPTPAPKQKQAEAPPKKQVLAEKQDPKQEPDNTPAQPAEQAVTKELSAEEQERFKLRQTIQNTSASNPAVFRSPGNQMQSAEEAANKEEIKQEQAAVSQPKPVASEQQAPSRQAKQPQQTRGQKIEPSREQAPTQTGMIANLAPEKIPGTPEYNNRLFNEIETFIANDTPLQALPLLEELLQATMSADMQEAVLYLYGDVLFQTSINNFEANFHPIMRAYQKAINYNPHSPKVPHALLQMGHANLLVKNIPEAKGYFELLKKKYPRDLTIPIIDFLWGSHFAKEEKHQEAAKYFQNVLLQYPEYKIALPSTIGLARALNNLNYNKQAEEIIDYLKKRWPRAYITDPSLLMLAGIIAQKNNRIDTAKEIFSLYYNMQPNGPDADMVLARLGDIALLQKKKDVARHLYEKTAEDFPDREGGLIAQMRLAEEGIFDAPSIKDMFTVFDRPYNLRPEKIYRKIINEYPKSPLAPVAHLKLAMWLLWEDKFKESLVEVNDFLGKFPISNLQQRAVSVGQKAFERLMEEHAKEDRVVETAEFWKKYSFLRDENSLKPEHRVALAHALWKTGDAKESLRLAQPFLNQKIEKNQASEMILDLVLSIYTDSQNWEKITTLAPQITDWELAPQRQRQADYALALAHENLGQSEKSQPLWHKLGLDVGLQDSQRAYALYFMALHAYSKEDLANVALFGKEALELLLALEVPDQPKIKDCLDLLIRATEQSGRKQEALAWALEYNKYVNPDDEQWPAFTYRLANLYKLNSDIENWKKKLNELIKLAPQSIYSEMATSDLKGYELNKDVKRFS